MTKLQWFFLWLLFVCYLFMGATFFYLIERHLEDQRKVEEAKEREEIYDLLEYHLMKDTPNTKQLILTRISDFCEKPIYKKTNETKEEDIPPEHYSWSFYNSFFFSLTTISTVGYGNIAPSSNKGRLLVIFFSLTGIPFTGIVLSQLGEFFGSVFLRAHHKYKNRVYESCFPLIIDIVVYLVPGLLIIIIVPALMFSHFEEWDLIMSIYYAYVTLTTIGFGDLVAGQREEKSIWYNYVYKTIIIIWVMFGLGYLVMVMGFIARGLRSKKVHQIEHKLASTIKQTRAKIWNEFVHDVTHVRRLLNEMYLLKVKRIYVDKEINVGLLGRSKSCPNFDSWPTARREEDTSSEDWSDEEWEVKHPVKRRRAFSEHVTGFPGLLKGVSESHLDLIDKDATFDNQSIQTIQSKQIFAKAVDAAFSATSNQSFDTGVNCFTDDEILASERTFRRNRAMSYDVCRSRDRLSIGTEVFKRSSDAFSYNHQNTWSGTDTARPSILKNIRFSIDGRNEIEADKEQTKAFETPHSSASSIRRMSTAAMNFFNINNLKKKMKTANKGIEEKDSDPYITNAKNIKWEINDKPLHLPDNLDEEIFDTEPNYPGGRRGSIAEAFLIGAMDKGNGPSKINHVLEQTSVADFLRLLSSVETARAGESGKEKDISLMSIFKDAESAISPKLDLSARRFSHIPTKLHQLNPRTRRYSQFSDSLGSSAGSLVPQRRKFSHVPSLVGSLSSVTEDRRGSLNANELLPPRNELKQRRRAKETPTVIITPPEKTHRFNVTTPTQPTADSSKTTSEDSLDEIVIRL